MEDINWDDEDNEIPVTKNKDESNQNNQQNKLELKIPKSTGFILIFTYILYKNC